MTTAEITAVWQRGAQRIYVIHDLPYMIWFKRHPSDDRLRWVRKSRFHLWRHHARKVSP